MDYPLLKMKTISNKPAKIDFVPMVLNVLNIVTLSEFMLKENRSILQ